MPLSIKAKLPELGSDSIGSNSSPNAELPPNTPLFVPPNEPLAGCLDALEAADLALVGLLSFFAGAAPFLPESPNISASGSSLVGAGAAFAVPVIFEGTLLKRSAAESSLVLNMLAGGASNAEGESSALSASKPPPNGSDLLAAPLL